jgi:hypothetical protein
MKKINVKTLLLLTLLSSCTIQPSTLQTAKNDQIIKMSGKTLISGTAEFPAESKINLKATLQDITPSATVSIIEVSTNATIATGLTDAAGAFSVNPGSSFNPTDGAVYILEAVKRSVNTKNIMAVRTIIKWNNNGWQSITTPLIKINTMTTALCVIDNLAPDVTASDLINKIDAGNVFSPLPSLTTATFNKVTDMVNYSLLNNNDPVKMIAFSGGNYIFKEHTPVLSISSISNANGKSGESITINGSGFKSNLTDNIVTFMFNTPVTGTVTNATTTQLTVTLPTVANQSTDLTGKIKVGVYGNEFLGSSDFILFRPLEPKLLYMAAILNGANYDYNVFTMNPDGSGNTNLTAGSGLSSVNWFPFWSADSSKIGFSSCNGTSGSNLCDLYVMNKDGTNKLKLTTTQNGLAGYSVDKGDFQPSGNKLAFPVHINNATRTELYIFDSANQAAPIKITNGTSSNNSLAYNNSPWSPSGQKLIFNSWQSGVSNDIYAVNSDGTGLVNLTTTIPDFAYREAWFPDGAKIMFSSNGKIYKVNVDGTTPVPVIISQPAGGAYDPVLSPDGTKIAYHDSTNDIFVINSDGSTVTPVKVINSYPLPAHYSGDLPSTNFNFVEISWSPDSAKLAVTIDLEDFNFGETSRDIYTVLVSNPGSAPNIVTNTIIGDQVVPRWSKDTSKVYIGTANPEIYKFDWTGSNPQNLTNTPNVYESWVLSYDP